MYFSVLLKEAAYFSLCSLQFCGPWALHEKRRDALLIHCRRADQGKTTEKIYQIYSS